MLERVRVGCLGRMALKYDLFFNIDLFILIGG